jgi:hypothetical protein
MPTQKLTQNSFSSGQYDRAVQGKEQSELVAKGLAKAMNVVSSESEELRKRLGTKYLLELDEQAVVVPFRLPSGDDVMLVCADNKMTGYEFAGDNVVPLLTPDDNAPSFPDSNWTSNTNGNYTVKLSSTTSSGEWGAGFNAAVSPYYGKGSLFKIENTVQNIPAYIEIDSKETQILESLWVRWVNSCNGDYKGHYKGWIDPVLQYSDDGESWVSVETDYKNPYSGDPDMYQVSKFRTASKKTESMTLMKIININHSIPHKYWRVWFMNRIQNTMTYSGERLEVFVSNVAYVSKTMKEFVKDTVFGGESLKKIKYSQDYTTLMIVAEDKEPLKVSYSAGGLSAEPFKSLSGDGYTAPASVSFFQNRLWFAGVAGFPTTVLGSKFGNPDEYKYSLTIASGAQYDDALNLKSNQLRSKIKNIVGSQNVLYCFSEDGISFIDGGGNGIVATNQSIEFNLKNRMPAGDATPTFKDDVLLYASADGTKLYAVDYDMVVERFQVEDVAKYAKDVVFGKITELHYINNESKLIYGLLENNSMFALLYDKGVHNGFFPMSIQNGFVFDVCPVKHGRDYRLVMVANRSGRWFLEELQDKGNYKSTDDPLMSKEDKKWATYDNLENNIALDCYKTYDQKISVSGTIENGIMTVDTILDLSPYVGQSLLLGQANNPEFQVLVLLNDKADSKSYYVDIVSKRGDSLAFDTIYPEFSRMPVALPLGTEIGVISEGRYLGEYAGNEFTVNYNLCGWKSGADVVYTLGGSPTKNDQLLDENNNQITKYFQNVVESYNPETNTIVINADVEESASLPMYGWGNNVFTLSATPSSGDLLYNADGSPRTDYYNNTVDSFSGDSIQVVTSVVPYDAKYAWSVDGATIYTDTVGKSGDVIAVNAGGNGIVGGSLPYVTAITYNGTVYNRNASADVQDSTGTYMYRGFSSGSKTYWLTEGYVDAGGQYTQSWTTARMYKTAGTGRDQVEATITRNQATFARTELYITYNGKKYTRDTSKDVPAGENVNRKELGRNSGIDIESVITKTIITKTFARDDSIDILDGGVYVDLPFPVHKVIYGATYESYGIIKVQKPYESMKSVQQINVSVINTAHLQVGTGFNDLQELEQIKDDSHYDLTNITMNGSYRIVPSDTPEWDKYIILRSVKGLPFTVVGVETFMNYSNTGGN